VSAFPVDGTWPVGTAKWRAMEGRRLLKKKFQGMATGPRRSACATTENAE
jgi:hypothetical protein